MRNTRLVSIQNTRIVSNAKHLNAILKRHVTLTNNGALGTKYEFFKMTGMKQRTLTTAETSLGRLVSIESFQFRNISIVLRNTRTVANAKQ